MELWPAEIIQQATSGTLGSGGWSAKSVSIDSRTVEEGDLFVALEGDNFDGHDYALEVIEKGAAGCLVSKDISGLQSYIKVDDTFDALYQMARFNRARSEGKFMAVTGSVGKTSTKEMLYTAFAELGHSFASAGNLNNHLGVPLSLCRMDPDCAYGIFEMGMNHAGEIAPLSDLVQPHLAIITTVEAVHLEHFDSVEGIADAKAEILTGLQPGGFVVLNRDNAWYEHIVQKADHVQCIAFGSHKESQIRLCDYNESNSGVTIKVDVAGEMLQMELGLRGIHQAYNALAVIAAVWALEGREGVMQCYEALARKEAYSGRGNTEQLACPATKGEFVLIDESYNASPASVAAVINATRASYPKQRIICVLGDMFELGDDAPVFHRDLQEPILENKIDRVFTTGKLMRNLHDILQDQCECHFYKNVEALVKSLIDTIEAGDVVIVKGSRGMHMETVVNALKNVDITTE